jgi:hypothetical protein
MSKVAMLLAGAVVLFTIVPAANAGSIGTVAAKPAVGLSSGHARAVFDLNSRQSSGKLNLANQTSLKRRELRGDGEDRSPLPKTKRQNCVQC